MPQRSKSKGGRPTKSSAAQAMARHRERVRAIDAERQSLATIFSILQARKSATRQEIEEHSGLSRTVVADRLATLSRFGLVDEQALGRPMGGRAPRLVQLKADAGLVLVAVINESLLGVGVANLSGKLLVEHHEPIESNGGLNGIVSRLETLFDWVLEQQQARRRVWGVGIAVPGSVEIAAGQRFGAAGVHFMPNREGTAPSRALGASLSGAGGDSERRSNEDARRIAGGKRSWRRQYGVCRVGTRDRRRDDFGRPAAPKPRRGPQA